MKRMTILAAIAFAATLVVCTMAGCAGQASSSSASASSSSASSASVSASGSASASAMSAQSQDDITAELKQAIAKVPAHKSVTVTETIETAFGSGSSESSSSAASSEASAESDSIVVTTVYKFDATGDKLKTFMSVDAGEIKLQYFSVGDDVVCVTDGPVYAGTIDQFDMTHFKGLEAYTQETIGDLNKLVECAESVEKQESNGMTFYTLTLNPEKYVATDEILALMAESGMPVLKASFTIGFEQDGSIASMDLSTVYETSATLKHLVFSDYDSTVIDPMPEADKSFDDMLSDNQAKIEAMEGEA